MNHDNSKWNYSKPNLEYISFEYSDVIKTSIECDRFRCIEIDDTEYPFNLDNN